MVPFLCISGCHFYGLISISECRFSLSYFFPFESVTFHCPISLLFRVSFFNSYFHLKVCFLSSYFFPFQGVIYRFRVLVGITLFSAFITVLCFVLDQVNEGHWKFIEDNPINAVVRLSS